MRITPDTSILARANTKAYGPAREFLATVESYGARLVVSPYLLQELARVLRYPRIQAKYRLTDEDIQEHIDNIITKSDVVIPAEGRPIVLDDPNDDPIVYTAIAGQADVICTIDKHFFDPAVLHFCARHHIRVMSDIDLLAALRGSIT